MFVGLSATLLAVTGLVGYEAAILRIIPAFFLLSWLLKYAFAVLDRAANGRLEPPVPSVEMLGPFEPRPLLLLLLCAAVYEVTTLIGGAPRIFILIAYLALLPASVGVLGVTEEIIAAINPLVLLRSVWALGWYYLLILAIIASYAFAFSFLKRIPMWNIAWYALLELAVLSIFGLIGGTIFVRRERLGFEPRSSPERKAIAAEIDRIKRRSRVLDEAYGFIRIGEYRRAVDPLRQWLSSQDEEHVAIDVRAIMTQASQWNSNRGLAAVSQCVIAYLIHIAKLDLALETLDSTLRQVPGYALDSEEETVLLSRRAMALGNPQLARTMVGNFIDRAPSFRLSVAAKTLLRDLQAN
jgi:hypothetical protein